jgi:hypothetical protein
MRPRSITLAIAFAFALSGCSAISDSFSMIEAPKLPSPDVPDAPTPLANQAHTVAQLDAHGTEDGDVDLHDLATIHGLEVKIDLVGGRRILTDAKNEVIVEPGAHDVTINKVRYPLTGAVRWKDGKIVLPGDARVVFGEFLKRDDVPSVLGDFAYLDKEEVGAHRRPAPAPLKTRIDPNVPPLPASWNVEANRSWTSIVIHHSATHEGGATSFARFHAKKWQNGLGYHFVIGNGSETSDGQVEVGPRWLHQNEGIPGAHAGVEEFNKHGIGICLVGDFDRELPTPKQLTALRTLVKQLMARYGIPKSRIVGHGQIRIGHTDCPGRMFPMGEFLAGL